MSRLFRTTSFRLAALYAVLFAASTGLLFAIVFWLASDALRDQTRVSLDKELHDLEPIDSGAADKLVAAVRDRMASTPVHEFYYGLYAKDGSKIVGDFDLPRRETGWLDLVMPNPLLGSGRPDAPDDPETSILALAKELPTGRVLAVGFDTFRITEAQEAITQAFAWAAAVGIMFALSGGIFLSRRFVGRVDMLNKAIAKIVAGDMAARLEAGDTRDELDQMGRNFNEMLDRLQASMHAMKQVSADVAHDLRSPLSRLRQRLEAARQDAESLKDYEAAVEGAIADTDGILATFAALLRIAQVEAGSRKAAFTRVDLSQVFRDVAEAFAPVAEDAGHALVQDIADAVAVQGDRELIVQMLVNLVTNAIRHTPPGTEIRLSLVDGAGGAMGAVSDNGPGIPEDMRQKVFSRFFRLEASRTTPGNGLGLSLVDAVSTLHGFSVTLAENGPGVKASFTFPIGHR